MDTAGNIADPLMIAKINVAKAPVAPTLRMVCNPDFEGQLSTIRNAGW